MSNRLLGILIIIGFIGAGYLYYNLSYLPELNKLNEKNLESNFENEIKEPQLVKQAISSRELTNSEKIEDIKENNKHYKTFQLTNNIKSYFIENSDTLDLYLGSNKIGNFNLVYPEYLRVELINGTLNDLYLEVGPDKFYYNNKTKIITKIDLNIDVEYVKIGTNNRLIFVTSKGSFIYSIYNNTLEYFSFFNDFVYFSDGYIGKVGKDEKRIINNLGFEVKDNNIVVYYNPVSKEKKIIYSTDLSINKIFINEGKFFIETDEGELFELENI